MGQKGGPGLRQEERESALPAAAAGTAASTPRGRTLSQVPPAAPLRLGFPRASVPVSPLGNVVSPPEILK